MATNWDAELEQETPETSNQSETPATIDYAAEYRKLQASYNGLKGHAKKLKGELETTKSQLQEISTAKEGELSDLSQKFEQETTVKATLEKEKADLAQKLAKLEARDNTRAKVREFAVSQNKPGLVDLYEEGLMPGVESMDEESRNQYLEKLAAKLGQFTEQKVSETLAGATPAPPTGGQNAGLTKPQILTQMNERLRSGGVRDPEYQRLFELYTQLESTPK